MPIQLKCYRRAPSTAKALRRPQHNVGAAAFFISPSNLNIFTNFSFVEKKSGEDFFTLSPFHFKLFNMNKNTFITTSSVQTKKLGALLAKELRGGPASTRGNDRSSTRGGEIICLSGDLGAGKTTFTQGLLKGLKAKGPFTSPTFNIVKEYEVKNRNVHKKNTRYKILDTRYKIFHIDAYRVNSKDIIDLGFKDFAGKPNSIVIIEWAERIKKIIPSSALWIKFQWLSEKERKITLGKN